MAEENPGENPEEQDRIHPIGEPKEAGRWKNPKMQVFNTHSLRAASGAVAEWYAHLLERR